MKTLEGVYTEVMWCKFTEMPIDGIMHVGIWEWAGWYGSVQQKPSETLHYLSS